ncbi:MAG: alpha/beta hydrolase, partial [Corynebacterium variabile]
NYATRSTVPVTQILTLRDPYIPADRARAFTDEDAASGTPAHRGPTEVIEIDGIPHEKLPYSRWVGRLVAEALS